MARDPGRVLIFDTTLRDGETDADVPVELQDKVIEMMTGCVTE